jgi:hypothetical protein
MIPLTPSFLIAAASSFVGLGEVGGDNSGQVVELFLREVKQSAAQPWCAAFVHHVGHWSHYDFITKKSSWPLPATASCYELGAFAEGLKISVREPCPGDLFLKYSKTLNRFAHTGIVVSVDAKHPIGDKDWLVQCTTIEGNTNDDGSANGHATLQRTRTLNTFVGDRFIRWANLQERLKAA